MPPADKKNHQILLSVIMFPSDTWVVAAAPETPTRRLLAVRDELIPSHELDSAVAEGRVEKPRRLVLRHRRDCLRDVAAVVVIVAALVAAANAVALDEEWA